MIELKSVTKIYNKGQDNECIALQNINLNLPEKGFVFIEGQSGSGKTTLLNLIAGIDYPTEGTIINKFGGNFCSIVFQDFQLIDIMTVEENLKLVLDIMPSSNMDYDELIDKYDLREILSHYPNQISGGQKQRVALVRALLEDRPVIVCDEPTGNLDEENSRVITQFLSEAAKEKLVIVVSHDFELFSEISDRHIILKKRHIIQDECKKNFFGEKSKGEYFICKDRKINVPFRSKMFLSWLFFKKNIFKNILTLFSLLLSFLLLLSSINGLFNTKGSILYNAYKDIGIKKVDFALQGDGGWGDLYSISREEYEQANKDYNVVSRFVRFEDGYIFYPFDNKTKEVAIYKMYVTDECEMQMLCGDSKIEDGEILVSDYLADILMKGFGIEEYRGLLGKYLNNDKTWTIGGVFKVGTPYKKGAGYYELECFYQIAYINYDTIVNNNVDSSYVFMECGDEVSTSGEEITCNIDKRSILYGEMVNLQKGEIGISKSLALKYTQNLESLVGQQISIEFFNPRGRMNVGQLDKTERIYTVQYVYNLGTMVRMDMAAEDYKEIASSYNTNIFGYNAWGIVVGDYTKNDLRELVGKGYTDHTYLSLGLSNGMDWFRTLYWLEAGIGVILFTISLIIICNHLVASIEKEKRILGILVSFGIKPKDVSFIYLLGFFFGIVICILIVSLLEIIVVYSLNTITIKMGITTLKTLFYEPLSAICLAISCMLLLWVLYISVVNKLKKKQIVDIIYER